VAASGESCAASAEARGVFAIRGVGR
jgi:hypothetical protein